jgi:hypothetical protein
MDQASDRMYADGAFRATNSAAHRMAARAVRSSATVATWVAAFASIITYRGVMI